MTVHALSNKAGTVQRVVADNGVAEGRYVAICIGVILAISALLLPHHQAQPHGHALTHNQIALSALPSTLHVTVAELKLAHEEIRDWQLDHIESGVQPEQAWPRVSELVEAFIPPFAHSDLTNSSATSWQQQQHWYGTTLNQQGLALDSEQVHPQIWYCAEPQPSFHPPHIRQHCQQVITGATFKDH